MLVVDLRAPEQEVDSVFHAAASPLHVTDNKLPRSGAGSSRCNGVAHRIAKPQAILRPSRWVASLREARRYLRIASSSAAPYMRTLDRKSTRLNSSHMSISYAVFCLKKKIN